MTESKVKKVTERKAAPSTVNVTIISMGNKYASNGVFLASGKAGKLRAGEVCEIPAEVAEQLLDNCEALKVSKEPATHKLQNGAVVGA